MGNGLRHRVLRRRRTPPRLVRSTTRLAVDRRGLHPVPGGPARLELLRADPPRGATVPIGRGRGLPGRLRLLPRGRDEAGRGRAAPPIRLRAADRHGARHAHGWCAFVRNHTETTDFYTLPLPVAPHEYCLGDRRYR